MHLKTRPMHVIWIFGSGFYVRRQVPRSNCCCLRFPHSRTQAHVYTQRNRTQTHTHTHTFTCFGANWQRVTFSRITCVFHHHYLMDLCRVKIFRASRLQTKCILSSIYFWRPFCWVQFFFFWIHFKVVFPHSILLFTFALALLTLSLLCSSAAPLTHKRQPLSVDVDVFTTRHSDTLTHTTHSRNQHTHANRDEHTHIYTCICKHSHYNSSENQNLIWGYGPIEIFTIFHMFNNTKTLDKRFYFGYVHSVR